MATSAVNTVASFTPYTGALPLAFNGAGTAELTLPVKNTFINFDIPSLPPSPPVRSSSCPPYFPRPYALADTPCWEGAIHVLCHIMAPKWQFQDHQMCDDCFSSYPKAALDETASDGTSDFYTPLSSPPLSPGTAEKQFGGKRKKCGEEDGKHK